jgi:O-antigen ligase
MQCLSVEYNKNTFIGFFILFAICAALVFPLSLSFVPHLIGVIGCSLIFFQGKKLSRLDWKIIGVLGSISVLSLASAIWAIYPEKSLLRGVKISAELLLFVPFLILLKMIHTDSVMVIKKYFFAPFFLSGLFICSELAFNFPVLGFITQRQFEAWELSKQITSFVLLSPFAIIFLFQTGYKSKVIVLIAIALGMLSLSDNQAAQLAALVSVVTYVGYLYVPSFMLKMCFATALVSLLSMPWISSIAYKLIADKVGDQGILRQASASQRLEVWEFISQKIGENPWTGFGIDSTRYITFNGRMVYYKDDMIIHPHNISLQIWIEFGVIGIILATVILAYLFQSIRYQSYRDQMLPVIIFSSSFTILFVSWSIWSSWFVGLLLLIFSFYQMVKHPSFWQPLNFSCEQK